MRSVPTSIIVNAAPRFATILCLDIGISESLLRQEFNVKKTRRNTYLWFGRLAIPTASSAEGILTRKKDSDTAYYEDSLGRRKGELK